MEIINLPINISQSFIKEVIAYSKGQTCGLQIRAKYIDRKEFPAGEAAKLGVYFEYIATGSIPRDGRIPKPVTKKDGELAKKYELMKVQAQNFRRIMQRYNFSIEEVNVRIAIDGESAYLDLIVIANSAIRIDQNTVIKAGQKVIVDLKSTAMLDASKYDPYSWNLDGIEERDNIMIQALHYKYMGIKKYGENLPFMFMVFSTQNNVDCKIISVNVDNDELEQYPYFIQKLKEKVREELESGFKPVPEYIRCSTCPLFNDCEYRIDVPKIDVVYYKLDRA